MTGGMAQMHDVADTFDEALASVKETLGDARRQLAAWSLSNFPSKRTLEQQAKELRRMLGTSAVEINAVYRDSQVTVASAPPVPKSLVQLPVSSSLCVIAASVSHPLAIDDIKRDPVVADHPVQGYWAAWASAPILVHQYTAGTVCALERDHARAWNIHDQEALEDMAARIGRMVDIWAGAK